MATKLNIFEEATLIKTLQILSCDEFGLGGLNALNVMRLYPFEQLVQINGLNHEIICYNACIIERFLSIDDFISQEGYLKPCINFTLSNLNFALKQENSLKPSYLLFNLFRQILGKLNEKCVFTIHIGIITNIAKCVLESGHIKDDKMKECLCFYLMEMLKNTSSQNSENAEVLRCVNNFLMIIERRLVFGFRIVVEIMNNEEFCKGQRFESIYTFMELSIKDMKTCTDPDTLLYFLKSLHLVWKNCTMVHYIQRFFSNTIKKLDLLKACLFGTEELKQSTFDIMVLIVNHEFKHVALSSDILKSELRLLAKYSDWNSANCDIVYIMHYLEFMYLGVRHNKSLIVPKLTRTLVRSFPTNPLLLKVLFFLYGAYGVPHNKTDVNVLGNNILSYLDGDCQFENLLTLHVSQLLWILWAGTHSLKIKTLKIWLKLHDQTNEILLCIKHTNNLELLLDILMNSQDALFQTSIIKLLNDSNDFDMKRILLATENSSLRKTNFMRCLIHLETMTGNENEIAMMLANQIVFLMQGIQNAEAMAYTLSYTRDLLFKFKQFPDIAYPFMESNAIRLFFDVAKSSNDNLANHALALLRIITQMQTVNNLLVVETIEADFSKILIGSTDRCAKALTLVNFIIKHKHESLILCTRKPSFGLTHKLMSLAWSDCRKQSLRLMGKVIRNEIYLAPTVLQNSFVVAECGRFDADSASFLNFLAMWLLIVKDCVCYYAPKEDILNYLRNMKGIEQYKVEMLTDLVNKCPSRTPCPTYTRYLN